MKFKEGDILGSATGQGYLLKVTKVVNRGEEQAINFTCIRSTNPKIGIGWQKGDSQTNWKYEGKEQWKVLGSWKNFYETYEITKRTGLGE